MKSKILNWIKGFDIFLTAVLFVLLVLGLLTLYSATLYRGNISSVPILFAKQLIWVAIGIIIMMVLSSIDYHIWGKISLVLYVSSIMLLVYTLFKGHTLLGARRWLNFGAFHIQPSEFLKITIVIFLSYFLATYGKKLSSFKTVLISAVIVGIPFLLVVKQPDLGTAMLIVFISTGILFSAGIPLKYFIYSISGATILSPFLWNKLADYQKKRILSFLYQSDPLGASYNLIQAKISVGSGQLWGKGLFRGTQHELHFLPMGHTDFIFCVLAEELGFIGSIFLLSLYGLLFLRIARITTYTLDTFGRYIITGFLVMLFSQVVINIGMSIGIMPITGVPLPFVSYGGSSIISDMIAIGVVLNVYRKNCVS